MRVVILKDYAQKNFPATPILNYAIEVEKITTSKKPNLILNVDGFIGVAFVDLLRNCGCFTRYKLASLRENRSSGFPTRSDINRAVQPQKMARSLKFRI